MFDNDELTTGQASVSEVRYHSNWARADCVKFNVGELRLHQYFKLLRKSIHNKPITPLYRHRLHFLNQSNLGYSTEQCLLLQPRLDPETELRYNIEISSYLYYNMPLLEILGYTRTFDQVWQVRRQRQVRHS